MAEKDCPAKRGTGPRRRLPPRVARGDHAQRLPGFEALTMTRGSSCLRAGFCCGGASAVADAIYRRSYMRPVARRSICTAHPCAVSATRRCAARRGDGPARGRCTTAAGRRRCGGGSGTPFPAPRAPRHGNVAVRAPVRARGHGAGRRAPCRCVAERATALKARVLHARAWNYLAPLDRVSAFPLATRSIISEMSYISRSSSGNICIRNLQGPL